jgi:hypothetical protein
LKRYLSIAAIVVLSICVCFAIGGVIYWQYLKGTPQYSLALLVEAAKSDDKRAVAELFDTDAVVDALLPQVIDKAVEIYGRGQSQAVVNKATRVAAPLLPEVKKRAKAELPGLIRRETSKYGDVAFPLMVIGAGRYLEIKVDGNTATAKNKNVDHPVEATLIRNGQQWKITSVKDERLASEIAKRIGQEIIAMTMSGKKTGLGVPSIDSLIDQMQQGPQ